jgi:undecaprenyl-diphosphatase
MEIIELLKVLVLGIVEGITEWLPISSTGHMILVDEFIKLSVSKEFMEMFLVVIQLGAIMAVVILYWRKLCPISLRRGVSLDIDSIILWLKVIVAVIPAAAVGLPLDDWMDEHFYNYQTVAVTLIFYGILFIVIENRNKYARAKVTNIDRLSFGKAIGIGLFQVLSLVPGTSRSGSTIIGGMLLGCSREVAAEFSFFLAIPVMFGASLLKILKFGFDFSANEMLVLFTGMASAFIVSIITIKCLLAYIKTSDFKPFGWYRIVLGILVLAYFLLG